MSLTGGHKAYANVMIEYYAYKKFGKRPPSTERAKQASRQQTLRDDKKARGSAKGGLFKYKGRTLKYKVQYGEATAKQVHSAIEKAAKTAVNKAYKEWKKKNRKKKKVAESKSHAEPLVGLASFFMLGVRPSQEESSPNQKESLDLTSVMSDASENVTMSRRMFTFGTIATAAFFAAGTSEALADNWDYIKKISRGAKSYGRSKAPGIVEQLGAGIRGSLNAFKRIFT